ncbi:hypothetical protein SDC9_144930 [bioreactor metagenome]|uniref:Uncharacterized protein n=1 Tax=bioreactor metagenome TaxID=1076179 RepID=A0A645EAA6_9ZZZZ
MRAHVPAIGQQRHGIEPVAAGDLHHHHDQRDDGGPQCVSFGHGVGGAELVRMALRSVRQVRRRNLGRKWRVHVVV